MRPARPNTHLAEVQSYLTRLAKEGRDMPSMPKVADDLAMTASNLRALLEEGVGRGLWKIVRGDAGILSIYEPGGGWLLNGPAATRRAQPKLPPRRCLRCRGAFTPEHRTNFLCTPCGIYAERVG